MAGGAGGGGVIVALLTALAWRTFIPPVSNVKVITCVPAPSVTGTVTVVHDCQPPVAGTLTAVHTPLAPLNPTCIDAPLGEATRSCRL